MFPLLLKTNCDTRFLHYFTTWSNNVRIRTYLNILSTRCGALDLYSNFNDARCPNLRGSRNLEITK